MRFSVFDFYEATLIKEYSTGKDEEISFRSTDILQEGSEYSSGGERKLEKTKQLLRKMANGRAFIVAKNMGVQLVELTIGSYTEVINGGNVGGMWINGQGTSFGLIFIPTPGFSRGWIKLARFKSLLNTNNFEKINSEIEEPIEERIKKYTKGVKILSDCEGVYPVKDKLAYYYIDRKASKLVVSSL